MSHILKAVLGPTNTGKTWLAIERMCAHQKGMIGFPLRLLARENYDRIKKLHGAHNVALITGEEKIIPMSPRWYICTTEAMPLDIKVDFLAVDEIQLCADFERGHIFTHRLLHARGLKETMFLGSDTMRDIIKAFFPNCEITTRQRMSQLSFQGRKHIDRLPPRSATVAFSLNHLYHLAEIIKNNKGGVAIVLGALSPRTRNAQVDLYQHGDVDYLIATDAIGMGLNLDINHVSFASLYKYDGRKYRILRPSEMGQIAGRAGRGYHNGSFGLCDEAQSLNTEYVEKIEQSNFLTLKKIYWRNHNLDMSSLDDLLKSLQCRPSQTCVTLSLSGDDYVAIKAFANNDSMRHKVIDSDDVALLWHICQIPDFLKTAPARHLQFLENIYDFVKKNGCISEKWFQQTLENNNRDDGHIEQLTTRLAHIRTLAYLTHWGNFLDNSMHWQQQVKDVENRLSDSLHHLLTQRFIDHRRSLLMLKYDEEQPQDIILKDDVVMLNNVAICMIKGLTIIYNQSSDRLDRHIRKKINQIAQHFFKKIITHWQDISDDNMLKLHINDKAQLMIDKRPIAIINPRDISSIMLLPHDINEASLSQQCLAIIAKSYHQQVISKLWGIGDILLSSNMPSEKSVKLSTNCRSLLYQLAQNFGSLSIKDTTIKPAMLDQDDIKKLKSIGIYIAKTRIMIPHLYKKRAMIWRCAMVSPQLYPFLLQQQFAPSITLDNECKHSKSIIEKSGYLLIDKKNLLRHDYEQKVIKNILQKKQWKNEDIKNIADSHQIDISMIHSLLKKYHYKPDGQEWILVKKQTVKKQDKKAQSKKKDTIITLDKLNALKEKFNA